MVMCKPGPTEYTRMLNRPETLKYTGMWNEPEPSEYARMMINVMCYSDSLFC